MLGVVITHGTSVPHSLTAVWYTVDTGIKGDKVDPTVWWFFIFTGAPVGDAADTPDTTLVADPVFLPWRFRGGSSMRCLVGAYLRAVSDGWGRHNML